MDMTKLMFRDGLMAGERILVTGGGTGLGKEMAEGFDRRSHGVFRTGGCGDVGSRTNSLATRPDDLLNDLIGTQTAIIVLAEIADDDAGPEASKFHRFAPSDPPAAASYDCDPFPQFNFGHGYSPLVSTFPLIVMLCLYRATRNRRA